MRKISVLLLVVFAFFAMTALAAEWKGAISDSKCGVSHNDGSEKSQKCVAGCVKRGTAPVLVSDGKVFKIANADKVMEHLGHKVVVTGKLDGETVTVDSIKMDH